MVLTRHGCKNLGISSPQVFDLPQRKRQTKIPAFFPPKEEASREVPIACASTLDWSVDYSWNKLGTFDNERDTDSVTDLATELTQAEPQVEAKILAGPNTVSASDVSLSTKEVLTPEVTKNKHLDLQALERDEFFIDTNSTDALNMDSQDKPPIQKHLDIKEAIAERYIYPVIKELDSIKQFLSECYGLLVTLAQICKSDGRFAYSTMEDNGHEKDIATNHKKEMPHKKGSKKK